MEFQEIHEEAKRRYLKQWENRPTDPQRRSIWRCESLDYFIREIRREMESEQWKTRLPKSQGR